MKDYILNLQRHINWLIAYYAFLILLSYFISSPTGNLLPMYLIITTALGNFLLLVKINSTVVTIKSIKDKIRRRDLRFKIPAFWLPTERKFLLMIMVMSVMAALTIFAPKVVNFSNVILNFIFYTILPSIVYIVICYTENIFLPDN
jgi:hypothetical protein